MKLPLLLSLVAIILLPGCAEEREGNGVNIHSDLGRKYFAVPQDDGHHHHSVYDK